MTAPDKPSDVDLLRQFLLSRLPEHEVDQLLADTCAKQDTTSSAKSEKALLDTLRSMCETKDSPPPAVVEAFIARLDKHRPAAASAHPYLSPPQLPDELGRLGGYRVLREFGAGGMGVVFAGEDPVLRRPVAIKLMHHHIAEDSGARHAFWREAQAVAQIDHPNVVRVYGQEESPLLYIVMALLEGESLSDRLHRTPQLPIAEIIQIGVETAQGLAAAHSSGLIHRDIKPGNLWLSAADGQSATFQVKVLDFGLARPIDGETHLTRPFAILGTPAYMAPEQANGLPVDARSDLFSLGCVLYEAATGNRPFARPTLTAALRAVAEHDPPLPHTIRPEIPLVLSALIMQLLSKDENKRPQSARAVVQALGSLDTTRSITFAVVPTAKAGGSTATALPRRGPQRRTVVWIAVIVVAMTLAMALSVGLFFFFVLSGDSPRPPAAARPMVGSTPLPTPAAYQGSVDILVYRTVEGEGRKLHLADLGALPLFPGDQVRVTAQIEPAAYLYLFWIDEEGNAAPVYPWEAGKWGTRPTKEESVNALDLPASLTKGFTISAGRDGMESLILLALKSPLKTDDEDLKARLGGLPPQRPVQDKLAAVWFENGKILEAGIKKHRADFTVTEINDPVLRLQERLQTQLHPLARFSAAVSFARQGKK